MSVVNKGENKDFWDLRKSTPTSQSNGVNINLHSIPTLVPLDYKRKACKISAQGGTHRNGM